MRRYRPNAGHTERRWAAMLGCDMGSSVLDLLCEDGLITPAERVGGDSPKEQLSLIRRALREAFLPLCADEASAADMLAVKHLDSLRVWKDLVDEDVHLRAPPLCA